VCVFVCICVCLCVCMRARIPRAAQGLQICKSDDIYMCLSHEHSMIEKGVGV
jgi:hypothetical protein